MIDRLEATLTRYETIEQELTKPEILSDIKRTRELSKEMSSIQELVTCYKKYKKVLNDINEAEEMVKDPELSEMAKEEIKSLSEEKDKLDQELEILLIPKDPNDSKNVVIEIRGAAGGDEANIFAGDLFRMYTRYAEKKGFSYNVYNSVDGTAGGFSQIEFIIKGEGAYSLLKYESGSHRVQRVPVTESNGRLQTSTATVLVMPEVDDDVDIVINPGDLRIDIYRSSGCGGQGVNTTDSAVRITHLPTNTVVTCQNEQGAQRRDKIGTGDRAEKIRTYNYPQNRVTDHRIGFTTKQLDRVMDGDLEDIINALISEDQKRKMEGNEE